MHLKLAVHQLAMRIRVQTLWGLFSGTLRLAAEHPMFCMRSPMPISPTGSHTQVLEKWIPKLMSNAEAVRSIGKDDRMWMAKAVYFGAIVGPKSRIPHHGRKELMELLWERYQACTLQRAYSRPDHLVRKGVSHLCVGTSAADHSSVNYAIPCHMFVAAHAGANAPIPCLSWSVAAARRPV